MVFVVSLGFLKFILGFEIDVCISFVAHLIHSNTFTLTSKKGKGTAVPYCFCFYLFCHFVILFYFLMASCTHFMRCATKLIQTSISKPKINFKKPKLTTKIKNHQRKLTFLYRQNALPLAYRYARHARHTNMHTDTHIEK